MHHRHKDGTFYVMNHWASSTSIPALGELSFPSSLSDAEQMEEVKRQVGAWLENLTKNSDGELVTPDEDYDPTTLDTEAPLEYSKEEVRPTAPAGEQVKAALHRPLRDIRPWVFCDMMDVDSLGFQVPEGCNCVVH